MNLFDLKGKAALVTGGNGGIGLGMARGLHAAGAKVAIAGRDKAKNGEALKALPGAIALDRRTRMLYDERHVFINGESLRAGGADARLMRRLADRRALDAREVQRASEDAQALLGEWFEAGWLHLAAADDGTGEPHER